MNGLPVLNLVTSLIKQITNKLVARTIIAAKQQPFLRNTLLIPPAQKYYQLHVRINAYATNMGIPTLVKPLEPKEAIDLGARLLRDCILVILGNVFLIGEYVRRGYKEQLGQDQSDQGFQVVITATEQLSKKYAERQKELFKLAEQIKQLKANKD